MQIGICASPEQLIGVNVSGLAYAEVNVQTFLAPQADEAAFAARLQAAKACPLPVTAANCFLPGGLKTTGPAVNGAVLDAYVRTTFRRARQAGIAIIVFGSGGSRQAPEGWEHARAADWLVHTHTAEKASRTPPGLAGDDFGPYLRALKEIGYDGSMSLECNWSDLKSQLSGGAATLRAQAAKVGL